MGNHPNPPRVDTISKQYRATTTEEVPHGSSEAVRAATRRSGERHLRQGVQVRGPAGGDRRSPPAGVRQQRHHLEPRADRRPQRLHRGAQRRRLRPPEPLLRAARRRARGPRPRLRQAAAVQLHGPHQGPPGEGRGPRHRALPGPQPHPAGPPPGGPGARRPAPGGPGAAAPAGSGGPRRHWIEINGTRHQISRPTLVLGRSTEADVRIDDPGVSRRHCEIRTGTPSTIQDLGSTNGIVVDGQHTTRATLRDGSRIVVGSTTIIYRQAEG